MALGSEATERFFNIFEFIISLKLSMQVFSVHSEKVLTEFPAYFAL